MRPIGLKSKIFLDSGDPAETKAVLSLLGFLDGQTTNPTLVSKNPYAKERFERGEKFSETELYDFYKKVVSEISNLIPDGSVSIEVYADTKTTAKQMLTQGIDMFTWIPNSHIKYPISEAGLSAAEQSIQQGLRVNMTLCFSEEQAAAVYAATKSAEKGDVYVSPFIGRLDDTGQNGMSLIANISKLYANSDGHTEILAASVRTMPQFMQSLALGADIITAPFSILSEWTKAGTPLPNPDFHYDSSGLQDMLYQALDLNKPWQAYNISHPLTIKGIDRFAADWNQLIS
jgi:transaldolase